MAIENSFQWITIAWCWIWYMIFVLIKSIVLFRNILVRPQPYETKITLAIIADRMSRYPSVIFAYAWGILKETVELIWRIVSKKEQIHWVATTLPLNLETLYFFTLIHYTFTKIFRPHLPHFCTYYAFKYICLKRSVFIKIQSSHRKRKYIDRPTVPHMSIFKSNNAWLSQSSDPITKVKLYNRFYNLMSLAKPYTWHGNSNRRSCEKMVDSHHSR